MGTSMSKEYVSDCGCVIHVIQWSAKRKVITRKSCPLHKAAEELLQFAKNVLAVDIPSHYLHAAAEQLIAKAEGK